MGIKLKKMKAIEFEADAKEGIITIPKMYDDFSNGHLKVILLQDEKEIAFRRATKLFEETNAAATKTDLVKFSMEDLTKEIKKNRL